MIVSRILRKCERSCKFLWISMLIKSYNIHRSLSSSSKMSKNALRIIVSDNILNHNANKSRVVELKSEDFLLSEVIVTCYFTLKSDPQTGENRNKSDFKYIQPWYESILRLGVNGIILHDGLDAAFIQKYQTDKLLFRYCEMGNYSIFEERWFLYHLLISKLSNLKTIFLTDSNDVFIKSNPFSQFCDSSKLYVGRDNANRIKDSGWLLEELKEFVEESKFKVPPTYFYQNAYNAGVVGGNSKILYFLTRSMVELIMKAKSNKHKDMTILNLVIHQYFAPKLNLKNLERRLVNINDDADACCKSIVSGFPFNSGFKDFDFNSEAVFIHK